MGCGAAPFVTTMPSSREDIMMPMKCSRVLIMLAVRLPGTWHAVYRQMQLTTHMSRPRWKCPKCRPRMEVTLMRYLSNTRVATHAKPLHTSKQHAFHKPERTPKGSWEGLFRNVAKIASCKGSEQTWLASYKEGGDSLNISKLEARLMKPACSSYTRKHQSPW